MVWANVWPILKCWVSKSMYMSWEIQIFGSYKPLVYVKG